MFIYIFVIYFSLPQNDLFRKVNCETLDIKFTLWWIISKTQNHVTFSWSNSWWHCLIYVTWFLFLFMINDSPQKQKTKNQNKKINKFPVDDHIRQPLLTQEQDLIRPTAARQPRTPGPTGHSGWSPPTKAMTPSPLDACRMSAPQPWICRGNRFCKTNRSSSAAGLS